jgi:glucuronide carrier protein
MFLYPLTDRRHAEIVAEIAERRAAAGSAVPISPDLSTSAFRAQDATSPRPTDDD